MSIVPLGSERKFVAIDNIVGEAILAAGGNDIIRNASRVDGGADLDTYLPGWAVRVVYRVADRPGKWRAQSTLAENTSLLSNVERVQWASGAVALDLGGNAARPSGSTKRPSTVGRTWSASASG